MYRVVYLESVQEDLKKLGKATVKKILDRVDNYLAKDPKGLGKALKGSFQGFWRYRWGEYRVIYMVSEKEILITVLRIGHRKDIYS